MKLKYSLFHNIKFNPTFKQVLSIPLVLCKKQNNSCMEIAMKTNCQGNLIK